MSFVDKTLICSDCGAEFTFTAGEQEFHAEKGFTHPPGRCPDCRARRRRERGDYAGGGSRESYGGQREMFTATCSNCGREAQVPFQPRGDKPVYCSDCFRSQRSSGYSSGGGSRGGYGGSRSGSGRGGRW